MKTKLPKEMQLLLRYFGFLNGTKESGQKWSNTNENKFLTLVFHQGFLAIWLDKFDQTAILPWTHMLLINVLKIFNSELSGKIWWEKKYPRQCLLTGIMWKPEEYSDHPWMMEAHAKF
jgi:hypothetical protein